MMTDSRVRAAKPAEKPYKLSDARGLCLQVMPAGGRYWRFNYRFNGRQKTLALGTYPDVPLARARERLQEARRQLAEGIDPSVVKQAINSDFEADRLHLKFGQFDASLRVPCKISVLRARFGMR